MLHYQVRAAEEILSVTRQMQELWLFGQLKTWEVNDMQGKVDEDAKAVARLLATLTESDEGGAKEGQT